ncbi:MAG TPA: hypothetical protein VMI09_03545 [Candidatus Binataceae bacterium]|nr:hypothetical protein [Candidatus Binataceae bacterium]
MGSPLVRNASYGLVVAAIAFLGFAASATTVSAAPAANFRAFGQGTRVTGTPDCSVATGNMLCPGSDSCSCTPISGHGTCAAMGGAVTYTAIVATDLSVISGGCAAAYGTATLVSSSNPADTVVLNFTGTLCASPTPTGTTATADVVNGVYFVDPNNSTGTFHNATGSGNVSGSRDSNAAILGSVIGTIKLH